MREEFKQIMEEKGLPTPRAMIDLMNRYKTEEVLETVDPDYTTLAGLGAIISTVHTLSYEASYQSNMVMSALVASYMMGRESAGENGTQD